MENASRPDARIRQAFSIKSAQLRRSLETGRNNYTSRMRLDRRPSADAARSWAIEYLRGREIQYPSPTRSLTVIDLYSGAGGLAYGIREGAQALGIELRYRLAMDLDREALNVY